MTELVRKPASASNDGELNSESAQTIAGAKTFTGALTPSGGIVGRTDGVAVPAGQIGETPVATAKSATGGAAYTIEASTNLTSTPNNVCAVTLNRGTYLAAAFVSITNHASASNLQISLRLGSTSVAPTGVYQVGVATNGEGAISIPMTPIVITADGTVLNLQAVNNFSAGTTARAVEVLTVVRIA